jgi:hypothetical protein
VMGTDGLWDNLFDYDVKKCLKAHSTNLELQADCLVTYAEFMSYKKDYKSPFSTVATRDYGRDPEKDLGGKQDDITVIVAKVELS